MYACMHARMHAFSLVRGKNASKKSFYVFGAGLITVNNIRLLEFWTKLTLAGCKNSGFFSIQRMICTEFELCFSLNNTFWSSLPQCIFIFRTLFSLCLFTIDGEWWGIGDGENKIHL